MFSCCDALCSSCDNQHCGIFAFFVVLFVLLSLFVCFVVLFVVVVVVVVVVVLVVYIVSCVLLSPSRVVVVVGLLLFEYCYVSSICRCFLG